ncbi:MAG: hypothetical protein ABI379_11670 [Rhodanobacter sp.]
MKQAVVVAQGRATFFSSPGVIVARSAIVALSIAAIFSLHELTHLVVGRIAGIPAVFTGPTSAGVVEGTAALYPQSSLALMNASAPLFTVFIGFALYRALARWPEAFGRARYFFTWWAIFGIPYLGLQMMIIVTRVDSSGNGSDSAAVAGYLHVPMSVRAIICVMGFVFYMMSAVWVLGVIRAVDVDMQAAHTATNVCLWRRVLGGILIFAAIACAVTVARRALLGTFPGLYMGGAFLGWALAAGVLTRWSSPTARVVWTHWLLPGAIGMAALIPFGFIGGGNDYASMWLPIIPPVVAAAMFAARDAAGVSRIARLTQ